MADYGASPFVPNPLQMMQQGNYAMDPTLNGIGVKQQMALAMMRNAGDTSPTMSPAAALARAMSPLIGAMALGHQNDQMAQYSQDAGQKIQNAVRTPDGMANLLNDPNPLVRGWALQQIPMMAAQKAETTRQLALQGKQQLADGSIGAIPGFAAAAKTNAQGESQGKAEGEMPSHIAQALAEKGLTYQNGQILPIPGFGQASGQNAGSADIAGAPGAAAKAGAIANAELPAQVLRGVATESMIPRAVEPTASLQSGFPALPEWLQTAIQQHIPINGQPMTPGTPSSATPPQGAPQAAQPIPGGAPQSAVSPAPDATQPQQGAIPPRMSPQQKAEQDKLGTLQAENLQQIAQSKAAQGRLLESIDRALAINDKVPSGSMGGAEARVALSNLPGVGGGEDAKYATLWDQEVGNNILSGLSQLRGLGRVDLPEVQQVVKTYGLGMENNPTARKAGLENLKNLIQGNVKAAEGTAANLGALSGGQQPGQLQAPGLIKYDAQGNRVQ